MENVVLSSELCLGAEKRPKPWGLFTSKSFLSVFFAFGYPELGKDRKIKDKCEFENE